MANDEDPGALREIAEDSRRISSTVRASFPMATASSSARADGSTVARSTKRPSARETTFDAHDDVPVAQLELRTRKSLRELQREVRSRLDDREPRDGEDLQARRALSSVRHGDHPTAP